MPRRSSPSAAVYGEPVAAMVGRQTLVDHAGRPITPAEVVLASSIWLARLARPKHDRSSTSPAMQRCCRRSDDEVAAERIWRRTPVYEEVKRRWREQGLLVVSPTDPPDLA